MTDLDPNTLRLITTSRDKFRAMVDGIEDGVMSIGPDFGIVSINAALAGELEQHPRDVVQRPCYKVIYGFDDPCPERGLPCPAIVARVSGRMEVVHHGLPVEAEEEEKTRFIEIRAMPLSRPQDSPDDVILVRRDVTAQRRAEIQLKEHSRWLEKEVRKRTAELVAANEELTAQRNELAETNAELLRLQNLKEDLTDMIVHDLKGPLAEIQANLEMLNRESVGEFQAELIEAARIGCEDLLRMITNLVDISRYEEDRLILEPEPFDVGRQIDEVREKFKPLARLSEVELAVEIPGGLRPLTADRGLFERILTNLISNALDYTPVKGRIAIHAAYDRGVFRFEVDDTGRGIPSDLHESIFEKFSQGRDGRPKTSSGLGLTFCRMAVEAHGGRIWVESEIDRGSRFIFVLPERDPGYGKQEDGRD